ESPLGRASAERRGGGLRIAKESHPGLRDCHRCSPHLRWRGFLKRCGCSWRWSLFDPIACRSPEVQCLPRTLFCSQARLVAHSWSSSSVCLGLQLTMKVPSQTTCFLGNDC